MRCWIGTEVEHNDNFGKRTLFVETENLDVADIIPIITQYNITSVYLGAGEIDLLSIKNEKLLTDYYVTLETSASSIKNELLQIADNVVIRVMLTDCDTVENISFKYRLTNKVGIIDCTKFLVTDISNVVDGRYPDDKLVYTD